MYVVRVTYIALFARDGRSCSCDSEASRRLNDTSEFPLSTSSSSVNSPVHDGDSDPALLLSVLGIT